MSYKFHSNIIFIDEELYEDYKNKKATFNNWLRRNNGTLYFQPDFEEYGDNHEENENVKYNKER